MNYSVRRGEKHPNAKLTTAQIAEYKRRHEIGESIRSLAREAGVSPQRMSDALAGRSYRSHES